MVGRIDLRISERDIRRAIDPLVVGEVSVDPQEFFASVAWSLICEPGDAFAGALIEVFGAANALALELNRTTPDTYLQLLQHKDSDIAERFGRFDRTAIEARERWSSRMNLESVVGACEAMSARGGWFVTKASEFWPHAFGDLGNHSPRGLWGLGDPSSLSALTDAVSFVGSRMSSIYGEHACEELVVPMVERGYSIVSGGAYGIDAAAHKAALAASGATFAMMAGGLDRPYPNGNIDLFKAIMSGGALLTEMPPGSAPTKWRFLQRNRLIAALGKVTVVVEANPRSGAVSTANRARELGRPIGAVPGPFDSAGSDGCHQLIRSGQADLISCTSDILEMIRGQSIGGADSEAGLGALETRVHDVIGFQGADFESICAQAGLTKSEAEIGLASLSLLGMIKKDADVWRRNSGG
jgi:DNA processing protein